MDFSRGFGPESRTMSSSTDQAVLALARRIGVLRAPDLLADGIPRAALARMANRGLLLRVGRGLYTLPDAALGEKRSLAEVARRAPRGVVCLLSALAVHGLTSQIPHEVWMALGPKDWKPVIHSPRVRFVRFSGDALEQGVENHVVDGVVVRVYGLEKTLADCFKYRHKIGLDVALEALRDAWSARRVSMDDLWRFAKVCRVARVMQPYLEGLVR
jgi:predicted transcriptional regulator of viral defense system